MRRWLVRWRERRTWEARWGNLDWRPVFLEEGPRRQVRAARESEWIPPDASVIDLGCGIGHTAAWLASLGHRVMAVDVSASAIERARRLHADVCGLTFERADVGRPTQWGQQYDVVLDLGCLHQLSHDLLDNYAVNVRRLTAPGSRLLYLVRLVEKGDPTATDERVAFVQRVIGPDFELRLAEPTEMQSSDTEGIWPGVELHFVRR